MNEQHVVCAAVRLQDGLIVCGARHFDMLMRAQLDRICGKRIDTLLKGAEQGFIDQFGTFLSRKDAYRIAQSVPQPRRTGGGWHTGVHDLYSEDLY